MIIYISAIKIFKFGNIIFFVCFINAIYQQQFYKVVDVHRGR